MFLWDLIRRDDEDADRADERIRGFEVLFVQYLDVFQDLLTKVDCKLQSVRYILRVEDQSREADRTLDLGLQSLFDLLANF